MADGERLFFALLPPSPIQGELGRLAAWCERRCGGVAVAPEDIHLTALFLGDLRAGQVDAVRRAAQGVRFAPFELRLDRIEYWPGPRLLCAVPAQPLPAAAALAATLRAAVRDVVAPAARPFVAHVTLLRRPRRLQEVAMTPLAWSVTELCLLRALRPARRPRYALVDAWSCA